MPDRYDNKVWAMGTAALAWVVACAVSAAEFPLTQLMKLGSGGLGMSLPLVAPAAAFCIAVYGAFRISRDRRLISALVFGGTFPGWMLFWTFVVMFFAGAAGPCGGTKPSIFVMSIWLGVPCVASAVVLAWTTRSVAVGVSPMLAGLALWLWQTGALTEWSGDVEQLLAPGNSGVWNAIVTAAVLTWAVFNRARRVVDGQCQKCKYDLSGNLTGICPECGLVQRGIGGTER